MRHFFVINPHSFPTPDEIKKVVTQIPRFFLKLGGTYKIYTSRYPRDAVAAVHHYIEQTPADETVRVYAVGGDGILFDCLNGMADFPNAELTSVPYGKSNDFIRAFGNDANQRFRIIPELITGTSRLTDIVDCETGYAINHVAVGVEAQAVMKANEFLRNVQLKLFKPLSNRMYIYQGLMALFNKEITNQWYRVNVDGEDCSGQYSMIHISNGACSGRTLVPSPNAIPNDGLLNAVFGITASLPAMLGAMPDYLKGSFEQNNKNLYFEKKARVIKISSNTPIRAHFDGETSSTYSLTLELRKNAVKFVVPEGMDYVDYSKKSGV
jgi:diacylglycerol kinase family enzyme